MQDLWNLDDISVVHFVDEKPWSHRWSPENANYREEVELWWSIFEKDDEKEENYAKGSGRRGRDVLEMPKLQMAAATAAQKEA